MQQIKILLFITALLFPFFLNAQTVKIVTNHVGYEVDKAKQAIIVTDGPIKPAGFRLVNTETGQTVYQGSPVFSGPVDKWKNWLFWTIDFTQVTTPGTYKVKVQLPNKMETSYPFAIGKNVLESATISDVLYYFKGQRSSGLLDAADHHLHLAGKKNGMVDAHGG